VGSAPWLVEAYGSWDPSGRLKGSYSNWAERSSLKMSVSEVIIIAKKFLKEDAGFETIRIGSVVGVEAESNWRVLADIGQPTTDRKELIIDDKDGKIVSYKEA
jgi:hypothetical protein